MEGSMLSLTIPHTRIPVELAWKDVTITTKSKGAPKTILNQVSGLVKPGQFLAIIGASGLFP